MAKDRNLKDRVVQEIERLRRHQGRTAKEMVGGRDPFETLVSTMLSARVRDEMTDKVLPMVMERWPDARSMARARPKEVARTIMEIGLHRIKSVRLVEAARALLTRHDGLVPRDLDALTRLPGVGRKTAGCVMVYAFGDPAIPVDTHVHRISNRLGWVSTTTTNATEKALMLLVPRRLWTQVNPLLVHHGKTVCRPLSPRCGLCTLTADCPHHSSGKIKT